MHGELMVFSAIQAGVILLRFGMSEGGEPVVAEVSHSLASLSKKSPPRLILDT